MIQWIRKETRRDEEGEEEERGRGERGIGRIESGVERGEIRERER